MIKVFVSNVFLGNLKENGSAIVARLKMLFILYFFITRSIKRTDIIRKAERIRQIIEE